MKKEHLIFDVEFKILLILSTKVCVKKMVDKQTDVCRSVDDFFYGDQTHFTIFKCVTTFDTEHTCADIDSLFGANSSILGFDVNNSAQNASHLKESSITNKNIS